ncbi:MAG: beta-lactamase family protein [Spirochaetales bacterium]|nr:beta-lactamase family protein [Spirochaetales bacterium]
MDIRSKIDKYVQDNNFSGHISIYRKQNSIYHNSFGFRDISNKIPNNSSTLFGTASGTKTFTALGIIKLIELGLIELSTTMYDIFQSDLSFISSEATIKQLLTHTSGIFDYYDEELITDYDNYTVEIPWFRLETPSDYLPLFESAKMKFKPGDRPSYSNGGYVFLGIIIEKLSGLIYRDFMSKNVFEPLNMRATGFYAFNALPENVAYGYISTENKLLTNIYQLPIRGGGDGGMYTNSSDMLTFWTKLFCNELIPEAQLKEFISKEVEIFNNQKYGLGIYISVFEKRMCYSANGCDVGVGFTSLYVPEIELNINVFSNMTGGNENIMDFIRKHGSDLLHHPG